MKTDKPTPGTASPRLTRLLGQSEHVKGLVEEAAQELSDINEILQKEVDTHQPGPAVEAAVEKSGEVEDKVKDASEKLEVVNQALHDEVDHRHLLEGELVEVAQRGEAHRQASLHDQLTGLPNRTLLNDRLEHGLAQAHRQSWTLAVLFADLDKFKRINDTHGHGVGDVVLQKIATRLVETARQEDTVCRYGGDEFVLLLSGALQLEDVEAIAQKLAAATLVPIEISGQQGPVQLSVSISIGIAVFPRDGQTAAELLDRADAAMFAVKRAKAG